MKSPFLQNRVPACCQNIARILIFFLMSTLTCSQIWLSLLADCQTTYLTKFQGKKKEKKTLVLASRQNMVAFLIVLLWSMTCN